VKWVGKDEDDWEATTNLTSVTNRDLIHQFELNLRKKTKKENKEKEKEMHNKGNKSKKRKKEEKSSDDGSSSEEEAEDSGKSKKSNGRAKVKSEGKKSTRVRKPTSSLKHEIGRELKLTDNNATLKKAKYQHRKRSALDIDYDDDDEGDDDDEEVKEKDWHTAPVGSSSCCQKSSLDFHCVMVMGDGWDVNLLGS
jgi:hypothetical protein